MGVPYTFGTATTSIPLSNLDANFNTPVTIGSTTVGLGNTVTTVANLTLTNATISSGNVTVTTGVFGAGSNTAPSITTTGDTNTGIYFPAADTIAFTEGGVESMRITDAGNVGIGTASPATKLTVAGSSAILGQFVSSDTAIYIQMDNSTGSGYLGTTGNTLLFLTSVTGTERMRITSTGLVGVGTSTPTNNLQVAGGISATSNSPAFQASAAIMDFSASTARFTATGADNSTQGTLTFNTSTANAGTFNERMRITSAGNVGIGTSSPTVQLELYKDSAGGGGGDYPNLRLNNANAAGYSGLYFYNDATQKAALEMKNDVGALQFYTGNSERMRITDAGEVYIAGTADQGAYNLQCNGTGVWGAGAYVNGSDARIKENIAPINSGLDVVAKLNPVTYRYKQDWSKDQSIQTGFIAQELLTALEGQVYVDGVVQQGGEYMSVAYQNIIPILTKAIQELKATVDAQAAQIAALESK